MKNQRGILLGILIIIFVAILALAGFFAYRQFNHKEQVQTQQNSQAEITDWKTYKNNDYNFEINYPANWTVKNTNQEKEVLIQFIAPDTELRIENNGRACSDGSNATECNADGLLVDAMLSISPKGAFSITEPQGTTQFNNITFTKYLGAFAGEQHFITTNANQDFDITCADVNICNQMLSTFKFNQPFLWPGAYQFEEFAAPDEVWVYKLSIYETNGRVLVYANLDIDGFQALTRIHATTSGIKDSTSPIDVIFDTYNYGADEVNPIVNHNYYKKGDILFTLTPTSNGRLAIQWKKMQPNLQSSLTGSMFDKVAR